MKFMTAFLLALVAATAAAQTALVIDRNDVKYVNLATGLVERTLHAGGVIAAEQPKEHRIYVLNRIGHEQGIFEVVRDGVVEKHVVLDFHPYWVAYTGGQSIDIYGVPLKGFKYKINNERTIAVDLSDISQSDPPDPPIIMRGNPAAPVAGAESRDDHSTDVDVASGIIDAGDAVGAKKTGIALGIAALFVGWTSNSNAHAIRSPDGRFTAKIADDDRVVFRDAATNRIVSTVRGQKGRLYVAYLTAD